MVCEAVTPWVPHNGEDGSAALEARSARPAHHAGFMRSFSRSVDVEQLRHKLLNTGCSPAHMP